MTTSGIDADVAVVGNGPVGNTLAILLAQLERSVVVLERRPKPYPLPRAVHFDDEVGRIFQSCGIGAELRAISEPADIYEWRNGTGVTLLRFGRSGNGPSGWPASSMFNQPALEVLLDGRARELQSIDLRRGVDVVAIDQCDDSAVVRGSDGSRVRARYVVGCDGAHSTVRSLTGLTARDLGFFYDWLIVDVVLEEQRVFDPINMQICDPVRPTTVVSGGPGRRRWEFMRLPHESLDEINDERRAWELLAPWNVHPGNANIDRHAVYTFNAHYAEQWRSGRVLIAGDAAHLMPPFAGQGMCAGIRDAANLAWKLDLALAGSSSDALLDTYQEERLPSAKQVIEFSIELGKVICIADPAEAAARDEAMAAVVGPEPTELPHFPGLGGGIVHPTAPHAGALFVQGSADGVALDDVHGAGWRLITVEGCVEFDARPRAWFESLGGRIVVLNDPDPVVSAWLTEHETRWVLQRPDFHVYGTADSATEAANLLDDLRRHLHVGGVQEGDRR
jgi:2-polyprenyl-6-methoxyphenol hydroxylase-like FAD-dependent oxidoreductase